MKNQGITFLKLFAISMLMCSANYNNINATEARITFIQHDGFIIQSDNLTFYVDMTINPNDTLPSPEVIFITHNHADHFVKSIIVNLANSSGAYVVGPQPVTSTLTGSVPESQLITYTPPSGTKMTGSILGVNYTIYGSFEESNQNSYRFKFPSGVIIYHNGDMPGSLFETFVSSNGCTELLNMNIAMLDDWAYNISDFYSNYNPDVMIKMHMWSFPCVVYPDYPTSFNLTTGNTYIYTYAGITENPDSKNEIKIFPNPSNSSVTLHFANSGYKEHSLIIFNATGQVIKKIENITGTEVKVEDDVLAKGLYIFKLQNNNGITSRGKFIIE
jgi:L-ascorbate metabolism protein UlaG (beta-lactamase superfamily)